MRTVLYLFPLLALLLLCGPSTARAAPDDADRRARARYEEFQRAAGPGLSVSRGWLSIPRERDTWFNAFAVSDYGVLHQRRSGSGTFRVKAAATPRASTKFRRMAVLVRFKEEVPVAAISASEKAWYDSNAQKARIDGVNVYIVERTQFDTGHFAADPADGAWRALASLWGPNWRLHGRNYDIDVSLAP